jgi:hypothetical protein
MSQRSPAKGSGEGHDSPAAASSSAETTCSGGGTGPPSGNAQGKSRLDQADAMQQCHDKAANAKFVEDTGIGTGGAARAVVDWEDPKIKAEVLRMIAAYLQGEGYVASSMMLMDEANLRRSEVKRAQQEQLQWSKKVKKAIVDGDWAEVEKFCNKSPIKSMKDFLYCVYKQQYLELVDKQEYQKAFTYLTKKLKQACVCLCVRAHLCMRACVRACVRACMCMSPI